MNDILEQMLSRYPMDTADARRNALYEVMQQVVLCGLNRGGFFSEAAFYGGTCLRIFHGMNRYSEDMDFTLLPASWVAKWRLPRRTSAISAKWSRLF